MEVIFDMEMNVKVSTSWYYPFWWKWPDMPKIPKIESWQYLSNKLGKNCRNWSVFYCDAKHSDVLRGSSHVRCYLFLPLLRPKSSIQFTVASHVLTNAVYCTLALNPDFSVPISLGSN